MAIFLAILFIYLLHSESTKLRKRTPVFPLKGPYLGAILESVLLGYSAVTGTTMRLLYCVEIQHVHRWYYNAEITCLEPVDRGQNLLKSRPDWSPLGVTKSLSHAQMVSFRG